MQVSQAKNKSRYNPFNFLKLDNKFNLNKIEQRKKEEHDKNVLSVYQKKLPNLELIQQCNKIMGLYKDHYNINRRFSVFYDKMEEQKTKNENQANIQNNKAQLPDIKIERSYSTSNILIAKTKISSKKSTLNAEQIMRPIKSNQYLSEKGIVRLLSKGKSQKKVQNNDLKVSRKSESIQVTRTYREPWINSETKTFQSISTSKNSSQKRIHTQKLRETQNLMRNSSIKTVRTIKHLKELFRKNIWLILHKLKLIKLSLSDIIEQDIFDKSIPYKYGSQIFQAIKEGNEAKVFRILMQKRFSIFTVDTTEKTTLMWACIRGYDKIAQLLLSNGVQPHAKDENRRSALEFAIKYDQLSCVKTLFIYSYHIEEGIQNLKMSNQMRKMVRIGISLHKYLKDFDNIDKKKEQFEHQYKYYFKE